MYFVKKGRKEQKFSESTSQCVQIISEVVSFQGFPTCGLKFMFSKKATKFDKIFTINLTSCSKCQIDSEDFVNFCGLLRKAELYLLAVLAFRLF